MISPLNLNSQCKYQKSEITDSKRIHTFFLKDVNTFYKMNPAALSHGILSPLHFAQVGLTTTCRPLWELRNVKEERSWSPAGHAWASHQPSEILEFEDACFCIYHGPDRERDTSFGAQTQTAICPNAAESTGCAGLMRSTVSILFTMCKYCVLDFIGDWRDFQRLFWTLILTLNLTLLISTWSMTAGTIREAFSHYPWPHSSQSLSETLSAQWLMDDDKMPFPVQTVPAGFCAFSLKLNAAPEFRSFTVLWGLKWYLWLISYDHKPNIYM